MPIRDDLLNPRRRSPLALPLVAVALLFLVGGAFVLGRWSAGGPAVQEPPLEIAEASGGTPGVAGENGAGGAGDDLAVEAAEEPVLEMGAVLPGTEDLRRVSVEIHGSLTASLVGVLGREVGDPLALVTNRLLVWGLDPSRDLRAGDRLDVIYSLPAGEEPMVHAIRFHSSKLGRTLQGYRYQETGARWARLYDADGLEVERRLRNGPIDDYEQITSLLRDGRRHQGVDFKAPVGTEVKIPWDGTVVRKNWNYRFNGGSLEVRDGKGRSIIFLHLDSVESALQAGSRVRAGQVVARSGNTGRSTAPHLHYQVMAGKKVLDPFDLHETWRRSLPASERTAFDQRRAELERLLDLEIPGAVVAETP